MGLWSSLSIIPGKINYTMHVAIQIRRVVMNIMATLEEVQQSLADLNNSVIAEKLQVVGALNVLNEQILAFQAQIEAGNQVTPEKLDELKASVDAIKAGVEGIIEP